MAEELEIKLTLKPEDLASALDWLLDQPEATRENKKVLINRYYDTPDAELNGQKAALRVRQSGDRFIQTLKTKGDFVAGAHRRQEWEWPLPSAELDLGLLAETPLAGQISLERLRTVFETNFERQIVMLHDDHSSIEVAIDRGQVLSGARFRPLNEVEFELKAGDSKALIGWAQKLASQVPVFLNLVSKAEQGYYLAGLYAPGPVVRAGEAKAISVTEFLHGLSLCWLTGEPFPLDQVDLTGVAATARRNGVGVQFENIIQSLKDSKVVADMLESVTLGQLQTALVAG
ncbi:CYTH domain-containing protein [Marinobacter sp. M216]|uniref:CYTH domain-containing protein n=1 Tax=Marinobacter albus TaxID=3030833 RepID=A0ABT7HHV2_9GAMM|nr:MULTISPECIES: CYTH domain-containing protein [unclassified Marinobacter]MBW7473013.1 CYTH domain-containing protein [Marinobacter sp. F4218]MDK9559594.1 CYTH domain-containing protein [Marinobacter sp. M216]